jgi:hypothetical protein
MIRSIGTGFGYAVLIAIGGFSVAGAAEGTSPSRSSALAASTGTNPPSYPVGDPPRHKPPQEAFDACKTHGEGDDCSVTFDGHTINGTCRKGPNGEPDLICEPARPPSPPPQAVEACKGSAEGASCIITLHGQTVNGTCRKGPGDSDVVACAPPYPPGPPPTSNSTLSGTALERKLDRLERDIHGR